MCAEKQQLNASGGETVIGRISSVQTMGTLDGPGVRFVAFLQGCPLRCACCHNPETWDVEGGSAISAGELSERVLRYREYFGKAGGVTLSGGEPLLQAEFSAEVFSRCRRNGIHTCLDTSGCITGAEAEKVLKYTDFCLLDIKYTRPEQYKKYVGCDIKKPLAFLEMLQSRAIPTRVRQVTVTGLNDTKDDMRALAGIINAYPCVCEAELLPFHNLCRTKYEAMGIKFPFEGVEQTDRKTVAVLGEELEKCLKYAHVLFSRS